MDETNPAAGARVKIEQPEKPEKIGFFYGFLFLLSFVLISFTLWLLVAEWTGVPLAAFLRIPVGS